MSVVKMISKFILVACTIISIFMCGYISGFHQKEQTMFKLWNRVGELEEIFRKQNPPVDATECMNCFEGTKKALKYQTMK